MNDFSIKKLEGKFVEIKVQEKYFHGTLLSTENEMIVLKDILNDEMLINKNAIVYIRCINPNYLPIKIKLKKFDILADKKLIKNEKM